MSNGPRPRYPFGEGKTRPDQKAKKCKEAGGTWQNGKCVFPSPSPPQAPPPPASRSDR